MTGLVSLAVFLVSLSCCCSRKRPLWRHRVRRQVIPSQGHIERSEFPILVYRWPFLLFAYGRILGVRSRLPDAPALPGCPGPTIGRGERAYAASRCRPFPGVLFCFGGVYAMSSVAPEKLGPQVIASSSFLRSIRLCGALGNRHLLRGSIRRHVASLLLRGPAGVAGRHQLLDLRRHTWTCAL